jgi:hypothetical protein
MLNIVSRNYHNTQNPPKSPGFASKSSGKDSQTMDPKITKITLTRTPPSAIVETENGSGEIDISQAMLANDYSIIFGIVESVIECAKITFQKPVPLEEVMCIVEDHDGNVLWQGDVLWRRGSGSK